MTQTPESPESIAGYDPDTETYRTYFDSSTSPSETVVTAIAALTGRCPHELPPLWNSIDPDALDDLFQRSMGVPAEGHLTFRYANHRVTVRPTGLVTIDPASDSS